MIEKLCTPAIIYLGFSIIQIVIDTFKGMYNAAFLKTLVMVLMTLVLNILCNRNLTLVAWLIVFIPFIFMSVIVTILLYIFGLDVATGTMKLNCDNDKENDNNKKNGNLI